MRAYVLGIKYIRHSMCLLRIEAAPVKYFAVFNKGDYVFWNDGSVRNHSARKVIFSYFGFGIGNYNPQRNFPSILRTSHFLCEIHMFREHVRFFFLFYLPLPFFLNVYICLSLWCVYLPKYIMKDIETMRFQPKLTQFASLRCRFSNYIRPKSNDFL